jgi:hypothetical protein
MGPASSNSLRTIVATTSARSRSPRGRTTLAASVHGRHASPLGHHIRALAGAAKLADRRLHSAHGYPSSHHGW